MGLYLFGYKLAISSLCRCHFGLGLKRLIYPISYWRYPIFSDVVDRLDSLSLLRILDLGSPKLLGLYFCLRLRHTVFATDLQDRAIFSTWQQYFDDYLGEKDSSRYVTAYQDARQTIYPNDYFDVVYSISVLEHIPDDGDSIAAKEICRVLKPGGVAIIEVPYGLKSYDTYVHHDVYERKCKEEQIFYQRHYDDSTINERLINPSGLLVKDKYILGERIPYERFCSYLGSKLTIPLLPLEALISKLNHFRMTEAQLEADRKKLINRAMSINLILEKQ